MSEEKFVNNISVVEEIQRLQIESNEAYKVYLDAKNKISLTAMSLYILRHRINGIDGRKQPITIVINLESRDFIELRNSVLSQLGKLAGYFISDSLNICPLYNYTLFATYYSLKGYIPRLDYHTDSLKNSYAANTGRKYKTEKCWCNWCEKKITCTRSIENARTFSADFIYYNSDLRFYSLFPTPDYKIITTATVYKSHRYGNVNCIVDLYYRSITLDPSMDILVNDEPISESKQ
jgi:hypothetical protein